MTRTLSATLCALVVLAFGACSGRSCAHPDGASGTSARRDRSIADPALPGLGSGDAALTARLRDAARAKAAAYEPRTHHVNADGSPKYINRLVLESSPYLLQHAHNPVNWYAWGDEAFVRARRENKPVLLSVGYSTCHWCHVMERESFEDEEIARFINRNYVAIKVDREERPDVDDLYMKAVQMLSGGGGWPMTLVLTPDREPFFAGTYFPPRDGDRGSRRGFLSILKQLEREFRSKRGELVTRARELTERIKSASAVGPPGDVAGPDVIDRAVRTLAESFDPIWGGFGRAPKFPRPATLELLLRYYRRTNDRAARHMVVYTLENMSRGGIYDQIGGGFHRYSTDARWLLPHFEKMLYDNAQLVSLYLSAYQLTARVDFEKVARETLAYVAREMTAPDGGFYAATDADSRTPGGHDEEGYFFTWTASEIEAAVGSDSARLLMTYYDVAGSGNFGNRHVLHRKRSAPEVAAALGLSLPLLEQRAADAKRRLYEARQRRPPPLRDDKILTSYNGLMISAFAQAALVLEEPEYAKRAERAAGFILDRLRTKEGRLLRSFQHGRGRQPAYLDDYAFFIQALLDLWEVTGNLEWLEHAVALQSVMDRYYGDSAGGYFLTSSDHEKLLARSKPAYDGAEPAGNSLAILNLLRLSDLTSKHGYRKRAEAALAAFRTELGTQTPKMLSALDYYLDTALEIVVVTPASSARAEGLLSELRRTYLPNRVLALTEQGPKLERSAKLVPLLEGKLALHGKATAYVCERGRCRFPAADPATFARQLDKVEPLLPESKRPPLDIRY